MNSNEAATRGEAELSYDEELLVGTSMLLAYLSEMLEFVREFGPDRFRQNNGAE
jgi:hypothetical protein